jgi:hypothetical protein
LCFAFVTLLFVTINIVYYILEKLQALFAAAAGAAATKIPNVFNNLAGVVNVNSRGLSVACTGRGLSVWHGWHGCCSSCSFVLPKYFPKEVDRVKG